VNYCPECGYKLEEVFKFCPNCGSRIAANLSSKNNLTEKKAGYTICKNCGEENPPENSICFSCGVPLKKTKDIKQYEAPAETKSNIQKKQAGKNTSADRKPAGEEKVLDNKKILMISSAIVVIFIAALILTGVFDSKLQKTVAPMSEQSSVPGTNPVNAEEIAELESKVIANPDDMESTLHLAHLLQDSGLYEKAITNYKKYLAKFPENADARVDMAICFYNMGDNTTAINEMETALKYQPKHQIAHLNLGIVNLTARNIDVSKEWFRKTVELNPNSEAGKRAQELLNSH
jgi:tetratricopeptide (TPR) repeat protein/RNA polymerase subunit RPABC4/transcription elongation factor Spt4